MGMFEFENVYFYSVKFKEAKILIDVRNYIIEPKIIKEKIKSVLSNFYGLKKKFEIF